MDQIGNHGISVSLIATKTFPVGFTVSKLTDDVSPIEFSETQVADHEFLVDGSLFSYDTSAMISVKISVIPGTEDDQNLAALLAANKTSFSIGNLPDIMGMSIMYPNQPPIILSGGYMRTGMFGTSVSETGRGKGKQYEFVFANTSNVSVQGLVSAGLQALSFLPPIFN